MKVAAVVLNFRTPDMTIEAVKATIASLIHLPFEWGIAIVDNDSQDGSEQRLRDVCNTMQQQAVVGWDKVCVIQSGHNGGFGAGNNVGIRHFMMQHEALEYIYILNSDAFPEKTALEKLIHTLDEHPQCGVAGSYIYNEQGEPDTSAFRFPTVLGEFEAAVKLGLVTHCLKNYVVPLGPIEQSRNVEWLAGASMLLRVKMIHSIGLFDETFFLYYEETDLQLRARNQGWIVRYVAESKVKHIGSVSTGMGRWSRLPTYWLDSRRHYFTKHHGRMYFFMATIAKVAGHGLWQLRCFFSNKSNQEPAKLKRDLIVHSLKSVAKVESET